MEHRKTESRIQEPGARRKKSAWLSGYIGIALVLCVVGFSMDALERNRAGMGGTAEGEVIKAPKPANPGAVALHSQWDWELWRAGRVVDQWSEHNLVTNEGLAALMGVMFNGWSQVGTWYVAIFENDYTPLATNTYAAKGFTECVAYDEGTRPEWTVNAGGTTTYTNSTSKATFTINATKTIYGAALVSSGVSNDSTAGNTIYNSSKFGTARAVVDDDVLKVTVTLTASDS